MRLLLDQGLPRSSTALLVDMDHDAVHVGDIGLATANDMEVLDAARRDARVVVTLDADFHSLVALSEARSPSVIRFRMERLRAEPLSVLLNDVLTRCADALESGALVTVQPDRVRVRRLPLERNAPDEA